MVILWSPVPLIKMRKNDFKINKNTELYCILFKKKLYYIILIQLLREIFVFFSKS
jgi:hypothetical protein